MVRRVFGAYRGGVGVALVAVLALQACAGGVSKQDAAGYDGAPARDDYKGAAQFAMAAGQVTPDGQSKNLVWSLGAGAAMVHAGEGPRTIPVLDGADG